MFGTIACGETWYWSEEGSGLGMDIMMKEGYAGGEANRTSVHWTYKLGN